MRSTQSIYSLVLWPTPPRERERDFASEVFRTVGRFLPSSLNSTNDVNFELIPVDDTGTAQHTTNGRSGASGWVVGVWRIDAKVACSVTPVVVLFALSLSLALTLAFWRSIQVASKVVHVPWLWCCCSSLLASVFVSGWSGCTSRTDGSRRLFWLPTPADSSQSHGNGRERISLPRLFFFFPRLNRLEFMDSCNVDCTGCQHPGLSIVSSSLVYWHG